MTQAPSPPPGPSRERVWQLFDRISGTYDLLNRLISLHQDTRWRRLAADWAREARPRTVLDVATGTADQLVDLLTREPAAKGFGVDLARGMMRLGQPKLARLPQPQRAVLTLGDAQYLPFADRAFDAVCISFGIRNVPDLGRGLREILRVLRPGGLLVVLETSMPTNRLLRAGHLFYLRTVLPRLGGLVSGAPGAYRYLNETTESFPCGEAFLACLAEAGFTERRCRPLMLGAASLYRAQRPPADDSEGKEPR